MGRRALCRAAVWADVEAETAQVIAGILSEVHLVFSTLPYVEEAVVVDTGSVDGTREILKEMQSKYQHLRVYDHKWKGFADARNRSLEEARTKRVLILDADEIIADEDKSISGAFRTLNLLARNTTNYHITSEHIGFPGEGYRSSTTSTLRFLSEPDKLSYGGIVFEDLKNIGYIDLTSSIIKNGVRIRHFLPRKELSRKKSKFWYGPFHLVERGEAEFTDRHPIEFANRDGWKEYNPRRDEFS